jgi:hypothetical protein
MASRFGSAALTAALAGLVAVTGGVAGCSSDPGAKPPPMDADTMSHDADFSKCQDTPAVIYTAGLMPVATSTSGVWMGTLVSIHSDGPPALDTPQLGLNTWVFVLEDAASGSPAQVTVIAERPWMPMHGHGQSTDVVVTPGDAGMYTISGIDPFQAGWWEIKLDMPPIDGVDDKMAFDICVPS